VGTEVEEEPHPTLQRLSSATVRRAVVYRARMRLDYRSALITGASSGLGRALAAWLARRGVRVYAAARRTQALERLRDEVGPLIVPVTLDVSDVEATGARISQVDEDSGGLDLVVANAGVAPGLSGEPTEWRSVGPSIDVNVRGSAATLCGALPGMLARGRGQLVAMSSPAAFPPVPRQAAYCASKAWLSTFSECLRLEVEPQGIHVTVISPGFVQTEMTQGATVAMPFLLQVDEATELIGPAIVRRARDFIFPWQMRLAMRLGLALPRPLYRWLVGRANHPPQ